GARDVEMTQDVVATLAAEPPATETALAAALLKDADRARTTMWAWVSAPAGTTTDTLHIAFEDYEGRCVAETSVATFDAKGAHPSGASRRARCEQTAMRERTRRSRVIARLPLAAGDLGDTWSVALAVRGETRVYLDSVVFKVDSLRLRAKPLDGAAQHVDSVVPGLSTGSENTWSVARTATGLAFDRDIAAKEEWARYRLRFAVPLDATFQLDGAWPTFEVLLAPPKTPDNPYGRAWTYAHAPMAYFRGVRRALP
ncbi:MAG TPA: hypothetical protein VG916_10650, partial [Gemmatimonadaceae bacterium]|nr:hypothetical protein [Gemmatimonadaceae bacterium]